MDSNVRSSKNGYFFNRIRVDKTNVKMTSFYERRYGVHPHTMAKKLEITELFDMDYSTRKLTPTEMRELLVLELTHAGLKAYVCGNSVIVETGIFSSCTLYVHKCDRQIYVHKGWFTPNSKWCAIMFCLLRAMRQTSYELYIC